MVGQGVHVVLNILLLTIRNEINLFFWLFFIGLHGAMTAQCAYLLLLEVVSAKYRPFFCAAINIFDSSANIWLPFYYKYVDTWEYIFIANTIESFILMASICILVTESP